MSDFDVPEIEDYVFFEPVGPPTPLAVGAIVAGLCSVMTALLLPAQFGWVGWALGFAGVLIGIAFRWVSRSRQMTVLYIPNHRVDQMMLLGVVFGFVGIVWNAYNIAHRVIE